MSFQNTLSTIQSSAVFKKFIKENPKAELIAGFFVLDFISNNEKKILDYKVPQGDKIFTFELDRNNEVVITRDKLIIDPKFPELKKISPNIKIDIDEIPSIAEEIASDYGIKKKFQKIIAILQIYNNRQIWNLTCILDNFVILDILVNAKTGQIIKFNRKTMADFVRKA